MCAELLGSTATAGSLAGNGPTTERLTIATPPDAAAWVAFATAFRPLVVALPPNAFTVR